MPDITCPVDGTTFHISPSQLKRTKRPTCSVECRRLAMQKQNHWNWGGGKFVDPEGYVRVLQPDGTYEYEHRLVAEKHLGRKLRANEIVRHRNRKRAENRWPNLVVVVKRAKRARRRRQASRLSTSRQVKRRVN